ncbi:hypothetical protein [Cohnella nanjingensis]|uniref:Class I SAM-dependent methyltransferase n=1 Tax=Cohnella nanjingensis TaxID=1387779 RepID=A0A7X0VFW9_9BACL|nr:hypothetical protein [Cohnella nanjingensis]MBB6672505.1 hypothetical protein [Cohnella nanjingensis]
MYNNLPGFDLAVMEMGILHYLFDLDAFFQLVYSLLGEGGKLVIREFHPVIWKLLKPEDGRLVASGDYFDREVQNDVMKVRRWTLGEVVTAIADAGLALKAAL